MRTITAWMAALALARALEACTASSTVDHARQSRGTNQYTAARDVAEEFIDAERWVENENTIESGTGCLLLERTWYGNIPNEGRAPDDWRSILGNTTGAGHGITATGREVGVLTVKDHMRLHVMEWSNDAQGRDPGWKGWFDGSASPAPSPKTPQLPSRLPQSSLPPALPPAPMPTAPQAAAVDHAG